MSMIAALYADEALRLANGRLAEYRAEARDHRLAAAARPHRAWSVGIRSGLASLRATLTSVDPDFSPGLPSLRDYPYRG
jgi:hypothetical protein